MSTTNSSGRPGALHYLAAFALLLFVKPESGSDGSGQGVPGVGAADAGKLPPRPKRSIKEILVDTFNEFNNDRVLAVSAGATFYGLLALFPAIASFISIYGLFGDFNSINSQIDSLSGFLPGGGLDIIREQIARITSKGNATLGTAFLVGLVTSLWSANAGMKAMFDSLNVAYGLEEKRGFFKLNAVALAFTFGFILLTAVAAALLVALPPLLARFVGSDLITTAFSIGRWPALFVFLSVGIALLYWLGPSPQDKHWRWLTPGSIFAALAWCVVSAGFSYYAANFGSYNATYGSLGAAIGLMTWMWLSITVILLGAELNAQIDQSTDVKKQNADLKN